MCIRDSFMTLTDLSAIRTTDITKTFADRTAVDSLNLSIEEGELFAHRHARRAVARNVERGPMPVRARGGPEPARTRHRLRPAADQGEARLRSRPPGEQSSFSPTSATRTQCQLGNLRRGNAARRMLRERACPVCHVR